MSKKDEVADCQKCKATKGRFLLHCSCLLCVACYSNVTHDCPLCDVPIEGKVVDFKTEKGKELSKVLLTDNEIYLQAMKTAMNHKLKLLTTLQTKSSEVQEAVNELINMHPYLQRYFVPKMPNFKVTWTSSPAPHDGNLGQQRRYSGQHERSFDMDPSREEYRESSTENFSTVEDSPQSNKYQRHAPPPHQSKRHEAPPKYARDKSYQDDPQRDRFKADPRNKSISKAPKRHEPMRDRQHHQQYRGQKQRQYISGSSYKPRHHQPKAYKHYHLESRAPQRQRYIASPSPYPHPNKK